MFTNTITIALVCLLAGSSQAFVTPSVAVRSASVSSSSLKMEIVEDLTEDHDAWHQFAAIGTILGLVANAQADVAFPGGKKTKANAGEALKGVAKKAGYKAAYGCEEGKCGTCEHKVNGKKIRLCIGKLPAGAGPFTFTQ